MEVEVERLRRRLEWKDERLGRQIAMGGTCQGEQDGRQSVLTTWQVAPRDLHLSGWPFAMGDTCQGEQVGRQSVLTT